MRKMIRLAILAALVLSIAGVGVASAQGPVTYSSSFQVQNLEGTTATVVLQFYNQDGTVASSPTFSISGNSNRTFFAVLPELGLPTGFNGSLVISSDKNVRAINNLTGSGPAGYYATTNGFQAGSNLVGLPLIMCNNSGFDTWFNVQNAGNGDAQVTVTYIAGSAGNPTAQTDTVTIKAGAAKTFNQAVGSTTGTKTCDQLKDTTSQKFIGSAVISSPSQPVVASVMQLNTTNFKILMGYGGFAGGANNVALPLLMANNSGFYTSVQVQNVSPSATANVTMAYSANTVVNANVPTPETFVLNPGQSKTIFQAATSPANGSSNNWNTFGRYIGSAKITSTGAPVVAIVNETRAGAAPMGAAYEGFDVAQATNSASAPLIMANNSTYYTSLQIQNTDTGANAVVTVTYSPNTVVNTNTPTAENFTLGPGASKTIIHASVPPSNGSSNNWNTFGRYIGSATITSTGGKIVAIVNQQSLSRPGDQFASGDAFNY